MSALTTRFDPRPAETYGYCVQCDGLTFDNKTQADAHMHETLENRTSGTSGHSIRVSNPTRNSRIDSVVSSIIDDAVTEAIDDLINLTEARRGNPPDATEAEITEALKWYGGEFSDAWAEYLAENEEDD